MPGRAMVFGDLCGFFTIFAPSRPNHIGPDGRIEKGPLISIYSSRNISSQKQAVMGMLLEQITHSFALAGTQPTPAEFSDYFVTGMVPGKSRQDEENPRPKRQHPFHADGD